jgi:hypothetical protein
MVASSSRVARADEETPSRREHKICVELRDAGKFAEAVPHCRAAYDALPDDTSEPTLNARSLIVFDIYHTYIEGYEATGDLGFVCGGEELMRDFIVYLDARRLSEQRPIDRQDAETDRVQFAELRGDRKCGELADEPDSSTAADDLLPIAARPPPTSPAPTPPRRGLRIAGGVFLGAGLGLGLVTAGALIVGSRAAAERSRLTGATAEVDIGAEGYAVAEQLDRLGTHANRIAIGSAIGAGAAVVTSVVLFAVDGRRRRARRLSLAPVVWPGGGQLSIRF